MGLNQYAEELVDNFIGDIAEHVYLYIELDEDEMRKYLVKVNEFGREDVNRAINTRIREVFGGPS
ncbi:MAG: hypothetical protein FWD94_07625 [Treponema sp.]|nr:hypothetical protein [Treponema sp.]